MVNLEKLDQVKLLFNANLASKVREKIVKNLSAVAFSHQGQYLWLGTDEFTAIERLTQLKGKTFGDHIRFEFKTFIEDFDEAQGEVDIEGLDYDNGYLWIIGSHSSKRKKVEIEENKFEVQGKELKGIERQENRYLLARIPIDEQGNLAAESPQRAWLNRSEKSDALTQALAGDEYLDLAKIVEGEESGSLPGKDFYFYLPSKENGLDIEGLAVSGNRVWIGLRGPVLRGIAILLEIEVEASKAHELKLKPIGNHGRLYKRHFLDLDGLGVRELCWNEKDNYLLVLAGPTMDLDGAHSLFRLNQPSTLVDNSLSSQKNQQLEFLGEIPHQRKSDRAEGLTFFEEAKSILVVYDSPAKERLITNEQDTVTGVHTDIFSLKSSESNVQHQLQHP